MTSGAYATFCKRLGYQLRLCSASIFVYPPPQVGNVFPHDALEVDLVVASNERMLFAKLSQDCACDSVTLLERLQNEQSVNCIVIHRAERVTAFAPSTVALLFNLTQLIKRDLRVIFVSRVPWHIVKRGLIISVPEPTVLIVPALTEEQLVTEIGKGREVYTPFVRLVVQTLTPFTNELATLKAVCEELYPPYQEEYAKHKGVNAAVAAFNKIHVRLHETVKKLYSVPGGREEGEDMGKEMMTLIVAAFLAGNNPPSQDVRYFTTQRTRKRSRQERVGEYVFGVERLLAVYRAVGEVELHGETLVMVGSLVERGVLQREGGGLEEPKFRCLIEREKVVKMARKVGIDVEFYLYG